MSVFYYLNREGRGEKSVDFALPAKDSAHMTGHDLSVQTHALINQDNRGCQALMFDIYSTRLVSWIWPILLSNEVSGPEHTIIPGNGFFFFSFFWIAVLDEIFWGYFLVFMPKFVQLSNKGICFCAWGFSDIQAGDIMQREWFPDQMSSSKQPGSWWIFKEMSSYIWNEHICFL